ncbi:MAG: site-specific DNA-methyltransferase [Planctomycetes bacterium]|nr:site-specific DNA-methyltransferase [Planctomycetota bacterium]
MEPSEAPLDPAQCVVLHGCAEELLPRVPSESVRLTLTDPPYNVSRPNNFQTMGRTGIDFDWDGDFDQLSWLEEAARALVPGGSIVIWNDRKNLGDLARALASLGFSVKAKLTWSKRNPMPRNRGRSFVPREEHGLWAVKVKPRRK